MKRKKITREALDALVADLCKRAMPELTNIKIVNELVRLSGYGTDWCAKKVSAERRAIGIKPSLKYTSQMKADPRKIDALISQYAGADPNETSRNVALHMLKDEPNLSYHAGYLAHLVKEWRRRNGIEKKIEITPVNSGQEKWKVIDGAYEWKANFGPMRIPVEVADQMFYEYSRHGLDLSQSQMRARHDLKIWEWHSVKRALFMYKDSNIFSPHTEDTTPKNQLQQVIDDKMSEKMRDKQRLVENSYNKETIKQYKKVIEKDSIETFAVQNLADTLNDLMADWKCKTAMLRITPEYRTERKWLVVPIADLHVGAKVENLRLTPDYSPEQTRNLLDKIARKINAQGASDVTLVFMGDLIESFTGLSHINSWQSVEYGMIGAKLIRETMSILEEFIAKVDNVREILGISGNHDRITSNAKEDRKGQVAEIIFYMLERLYGANVQIQFSDLVISKQIDGVQYVFAHGDKKVIREGKQAVIDYGDSNLFNVIVTAHIHHRKIIEDERSFRWVSVPAVFTGNRYSEENAWNARAGFDTFENDGSGTPQHTSHTIA